MNKMQDDVLRFHAATGSTIGTGPPAIRDAALRARLIREEAEEMADALERGDLVGVIDGACDVIYVALGTLVAAGVDIQPYWDEVHRTNMAKVRAGVQLDADGKILKPHGWAPPRISEILDGRGGRYELPECVRSSLETLRIGMHDWAEVGTDGERWLLAKLYDDPESGELVAARVAYRVKWTKKP